MMPSLQAPFQFDELGPEQFNAGLPWYQESGLEDDEEEDDGEKYRHSIFA